MSASFIMLTLFAECAHNITKTIIRKLESKVYLANIYKKHFFVAEICWVVWRF